MAFSTALAFAYRPMSSPASALSVAKSASTADAGSVGVSRAMTVTPAWRAFSIAGTTAVESAGVMRMPFAPIRGHLRERRHLARVVDVALPRGGQQLDVVVAGGLLRGVLDLDEERVACRAW